MGLLEIIKSQEINEYENLIVIVNSKKQEKKVVMEESLNEVQGLMKMVNPYYTCMLLAYM